MRRRGTRSKRRASKRRKGMKTSKSFVFSRGGIRL